MSRQGSALSRFSQNAADRRELATTKRRKEESKGPQVNKFADMKWDAAFVKKLHDIRECQDRGRMYDKKRIDKHLFGFCEKDPDSKYENEIIKLLRLKYALKR